MDPMLVKWIEEIDRPGRILVIFDQDKWTYSWRDEFLAIADRIRKSTRFLKVRLGGNSYRGAIWTYGMFMGQPDENMSRFEFFLCKDFWPFGPLAVHAPLYDGLKLFELNQIEIHRDSDIAKEINGYDLRASGGPREWRAGRTSSKGDWALGDVVMVRGYGEVSPATDVLSPDTSKNFTAYRRMLFENANVQVCWLKVPWQRGPISVCPPPDRPDKHDSLKRYCDMLKANDSILHDPRSLTP